MLLEDERHEIVQYCRHFQADGLTAGTAGNISIRRGDQVAITPGHVGYEAMDPTSICVVDLEGHLLTQQHVPSSELPMHLTVYRHTNAGAIVHTHSMFATVLSATVSELPAVHYAIATLGGPVRVADYATFGSKDLARNVLRSLSGRSAAILKNHGTVTYGDTLEEAYDRAMTLEWVSQVYYRARLLGEPSIVALSEIDHVYDEMVARGYATENIEKAREGAIPAGSR